MSVDLMRYDRMVERAMRGVLRDALRHVRRHGLPGDHHLYITFRTDHPESELSEALRQRHPGDMTIVLQHQFWDLDVGDNSFAVTLSFNNQQERLSVPFAAVTAFADPSINFGLQFAADRDDAIAPATAPAADRSEEPGEERPAADKVVALDTFRKK